jgi:hypothetical protein
MQIDRLGFHPEVSKLMENSELQELKDFTIILSNIIMGFAIQLLYDLSQIAPIISVERELVDDLLQDSLHDSLRNYFLELKNNGF